MCSSDSDPGNIAHPSDLRTMVRGVSMASGAVPLAPDEPELVYHYTDPGGLFGIITKKVLWASDVWFMNDAQEALYGLEAIERALESFNLPPGTGTEVRRRALGWLQTNPEAGRSLSVLHRLSELRWGRSQPVAGVWPS